jgi:erythromycin esterase-like protein
MTRLPLLALILWLLNPCAAGASVRADQAAAAPALAAAVRDMCGSEVAALGEPAGHGDGRTLAFKAALVRELVERCGFDAIFFEGSSYDFLELERRQRRGDPVTQAMVSSAVGGLWNRYAETQPLMTWLHERLTSGGLRLGGFDDQLGSAGAFYSIAAMPAELSGLLASGRASACREEFRRRIHGEVGTSAPERAPLLTCIAEIRASLRTQSAGTETAERLHMLANIERYAMRDWSDEAGHMRQRDHSMWLNYQWLRARLPRRSKVILWGATVHLARDATASPGFPAGGNFGAYLDRAHRGRAFFLGFTAGSGSYRWGGEVKTLPPARPGSLEQAALRGTRAEQVYLGRRRLRALGRIQGGVFAHDPLTAAWSRVIDGLIVFREEQAPVMAPPAQ